MRRLIPPGRSLTYYAAVSWLVPGLAAIVVCLFAFLGSSALQYRADKNRVLEKLQLDSMTVARRISAEVLIGPRGAIDSVLSTLQEDLSLNSVGIDMIRPPCLSDGQEACSAREGNRLAAYQKVPVVGEPQYVVARVLAPRLGSYFKITNLLWSTLPIALMLGLGLLFQRLILRSYFLRPVQALVETSTGDREPRGYWPKELRDISDRLYKSFEGRDEAVYSQVVRGVIHDLRTLLQSPIIATELAVESRGDDSIRKERLENLEDVCAQQLPKMREIIDTALDGSRDVSLSTRRESLAKAVNGALRSLEPFSTRLSTRLELRGNHFDDLVTHDPVQLERALTNIVKNGIEASSGESSRQRAVAISIERQPDYVLIEIEDSGPGLRIQPDRLFKALRSTKPHGSGLGLIVSRKIIAAHGGALMPGRSERLGGAKFSITLPVSREVT